MFQAFEEAKMEDKVRKMQQLKDKEKEDLVTTLQSGQSHFNVLGLTHSWAVVLVVSWSVFMPSAPMI